MPVARFHACCLAPSFCWRGCSVAYLPFEAAQCQRWRQIPSEGYLFVLRVLCRSDEAWAHPLKILNPIVGLWPRCQSASPLLCSQREGNRQVSFAVSLPLHAAQGRCGVSLPVAVLWMREQPALEFTRQADGFLNWTHAAAQSLVALIIDQMNELKDN